MTFFHRVHADDRGGQRHNFGWSLVWPVCDICGAVLADEQLHDKWHDLIKDQEDEERE